MKILKKTKNIILDTLFPVSCLNCGQPDVWFCESCLNRIKPLSFQVCPKCEKILTESGKTCQWCKKDYPLKALVVATKYKEENVSKLVHLYKYNFITDLRIPLGEMMLRALTKNDLPLPDIIVPVPLHPRRLRWRGFNQSQLLGDFIAKNLTPGFEIPVVSDLLFRKRYTPPQMKTKDYAGRRENLADAFTVTDTEAHRIRNKRILLVDDIATTGSTLIECAKALKQKGAKEIFGAVIARQEFND